MSHDTHLAGLWYLQRKSKRSSGTGTLLSFGSMVQNGKFSAAAWLLVSTLKKVDFLWWIGSGTGWVQQLFAHAKTNVLEKNFYPHTQHSVIPQFLFSERFRIDQSMEAVSGLLPFWGASASSTSVLHHDHIFKYFTRAMLIYTNTAIHIIIINLIMFCEEAPSSWGDPLNNVYRQLCPFKHTNANVSFQLHETTPGYFFATTSD